MLENCAGEGGCCAPMHLSVEAAIVWMGFSEGTNGEQGVNFVNRRLAIEITSFDVKLCVLHSGTV